MIEIEKKIIVYSYLITEIFCCDCFFDRIMSLISSSEEFSRSDKFINILENEFSTRCVIILSGGKILLICREVIKFILKIKKDDQKMKLSRCIRDFISVRNEIVDFCSICFIKIIEDKKLLKHFKTKKKIRDETYYLYL